ncbi:MAG TPA: immunoglobulin domain-containing protein [Opitutaceae bacterium]|nr:immunoglobulin domain-containing protein [Opitutaceae bacterium]
MWSRFLPATVLLLFAARSSPAYTLTGSHWYSSPVTMQLELGAPATPLSDGSSSWDASAENALAVWNNYIGAVRFTAVPGSNAPIAEGNGVNNVFFSNDVYGTAWGTGVLAVTLTYTSGGSRTSECDVLFNRTLAWDSYRGPLHYDSSGAGIYDFQRVAIHEFGHVLGLDHPDQAGQSVVAIMNSRISNLDTVAADDITGAQSLYGANATTALPPAPVITTQPVSQTVAAGGAVTLSVAVGTSVPATYQWYKDGSSIPGATASTLVVTNVTSADTGQYYVVVANPGGSVTSAGARLTVIARPAAPIVITPPSAQTVTDGAPAVLTVAATGTPPVTFQWQKNGMNIAGATQATFTLPVATPTDAGTYAVIVTNAAGSVTTVPVLLTVLYSQLVNLSTRGVVPSGGALTAGFVLRGSGRKPVLVRGIGPALGNFGVTDALSDPQLSVIAQSSNQTLAVNSGWTQTPSLSPVFQSVGAFPLPIGSTDAASDISLSPGAYTTRVTSSSTGPAGVALAELYDGDAASPAARLINLSTLGFTGTGDNTLVAGFSIQGNAPKRVLIRAIGPTLASYGVSGWLANPRLDVYPLGQSASLAGNDDWGGTPELTAAFATAGAFALPSDSRDAAVILTLAPGGYTVVVSGVGGEQGYALVEIYDLDP